MPTLRFEDLRHDPNPEWNGERWGADGRPVLLLGGTGDDRSAWWPVAARLADEHAVAVLDLPEHRSIGDQAEALAVYVAALGTRAPVVAGHGRAALVASLFALRYLAHGVVNIEQPLDEPPGDDDARAAWEAITARPGTVRCPYLAVFAAEPHPDYLAWLRERAPQARLAVYGTTGGFPHLASAARFTADIRTMTR